MDDLPKRKTTRLKNFNYNNTGAVFLTICTQNRRCILSHIISAGTGVPDGPANHSHLVGTGVPDGPTNGLHHVGTGVPDGPTNDLHHVGTGAPDGPTNDLHLVGTGVPDGPFVELSQYGKIADKYINQLGNFYEYLSVERYVIMPNHIHIMLFISDCGPSGTPVPTLQNSVVSRFVSTFKRFCNKEYGKNIWQARSYDHVIRSREDYDEHIKYIYENPVRWYYDELYSEE